MIARLFVPAVCVLALAAQAPEPAKPASAAPPAAEKKAPETPPDVKAYSEISKITDPEKKIEGYEKFKKDFPDSRMKDAADSSILNTLVSKFPKQTDRIRQFSATFYKNTEAKDRASQANFIAGVLLGGDLLLKDAESYAKKSVESTKLSSYMAEQIAAAEKRKAKPPTSEDLQKRFLTMRAGYLATYGRIELKLGHADKGRKLLEESYTGNKENPLVLGALGEMAAKAGKDDKALELLIPARLSGRASKEANAAFEAIYAKRHNGSLEGLDAMLDTEYKKLYPNPVPVTAYQPTEKRSDRVVLAEVFTGSGCPPCLAADLAFDAAMERYAHKDFAVLMFHQHIPRPDPMTNPQTQARAKFYSVNGVPSYFVDGKSPGGGGGDRQYAKTVYDRFNKEVEKNLETPAEAHITAGVNLTGKTVKVHATVRGVTGDTKDVKVQIALVEKELRFNGENGIRFHPMVVRAIEGYALSGETYDQAFDLDEISKVTKDHLDDYEAKGHRGEPFKFTEKKYQIDRNDLAVVIFVQDEKTKHVLQAGYIDLGSEPGRPTTPEANGQK